jgi:hypothetical protein
MIQALTVSCPHCKVSIGESCVGPASPGKSLNSRRPLRFSEAHPQRIALAAVIDAGGTAREARVAARYAVLTTQPTEIVPYLEIARMAVEDAGHATISLYRKVVPPVPDHLTPKVDAIQPELSLE